MVNSLPATPLRLCGMSRRVLREPQGGPEEARGRIDLQTQAANSACNLATMVVR